MRKSLINVAAGILIGVALTVSLPAYGAAKQYMLTLFEKPVIVNGTKYSDASNPILNYNGKTYIPLAKIGDLTGVQYTWNAAKNQVEINSSKQATVNIGKEDTQPTKELSNGNTGSNGNLGPGTPIEPADPEAGYKGHADSEDPSYQWAVGEKLPLPPLMSKGWISDNMLVEVASIHFGWTDNDNEAILYTGAQWNQKILHKFKVSDEFIDAKDGDFVIDGFHIKKFNSNVFFSIGDLEQAGIL